MVPLKFDQQNTKKSKLIHPPIVDDVTIRMLEYLIHNNNLRN